MFNSAHKEIIKTTIDWLKHNDGQTVDSPERFDHSPVFDNWVLFTDPENDDNFLYDMEELIRFLHRTKGIVTRALADTHGFMAYCAINTFGTPAQIYGVYDYDMLIDEFTSRVFLMPPGARRGISSTLLERQIQYLQMSLDNGFWIRPKLLTQPKFDIWYT